MFHYFFLIDRELLLTLRKFYDRNFKTNFVSKAINVRKYEISSKIFLKKKLYTFFDQLYWDGRWFDKLIPPTIDRARELRASGQGFISPPSCFFSLR